MKIKNISHRGLPSRHCENSIAALCEKVHRWDGVEFDVQFTKDKKIVIHHDETYERMYEVTEKVADVMYADIVTISSKHPNEPIGTLQELLERMAGVSKRIILDIELKFHSPLTDTSSSLGCVELYNAVSSMVTQHNLHHTVVLTSFHHTFLAHTACVPILDTVSVQVQHPLVQHPNMVVHDKYYCTNQFILSLFVKQNQSTPPMDVLSIYTFVTTQERQTFIQQVNTSQLQKLTGELWLIGDC